MNGPSTTQASAQHQLPQLLFYDRQVLKNLIRPMTAMGLSNPNQVEVSLQVNAQGIQHGQCDPQIVGEKINIQVNQDGEENGQNVQTSKECTITVRRDPW